MFSDNDIKIASHVSRFMMELYKIDEKRYSQAMSHGIPFGDMAYAQALANWRKNGKPSNAFFSWAESEQECTFTIEFRKEISAEFGLPILTQSEARNERAKYSRIRNIKVTDWGMN